MGRAKVGGKIKVLSLDPAADFSGFPFGQADAQALGLPIHGFCHLFIGQHPFIDQSGPFEEAVKARDIFHQFLGLFLEEPFQPGLGGTAQKG